MMEVQAMSAFVQYHTLGQDVSTVSEIDVHIFIMYLLGVVAQPHTLWLYDTLIILNMTSVEVFMLR